MRYPSHRTALKVRGGKVLRKNRHEPSPSYWNTPPDQLVIDRRRPGRGYRHLMRGDDVRRFCALLPHWDTLAQGLHAIVLDEGSEWWFGKCHTLGVIRLSAWPRELWTEHYECFYREHRSILRRLKVPTHRQEERGQVWVQCRFTEATARAFLLIHVLVHELGHHHDRLTNRNPHDLPRGEPYAEAYAREFEPLLFDRYEAEFGPVSK